MDKRRAKRYTTKLHVKLHSGSIISWGILCDVSENGLFLKCSRDFSIEAVINLEIFMPDNINSLLKGIIRRKIEMSDSYRKHGLGIELIEKDTLYMQYLKYLAGARKNP